MIDNLKHAARNDGAFIGGGAFTQEECKQAAALLEAAPDLLAELVKITDAYAQAMKDAGVTHYPEALVVVRQARAAIAKATGGAK